MRPGGRGCVRSIPVRPGGRWVISGAFGSFPCALGFVGFVGVRSVHTREPWGWRVRSCAFGSYPCAIGWRVRSCAFGPLPCDLVVFVFVWERSVDSLAPWVSSGSFECVRSTPVVPGFRSGTFGQFPYAVEVVGAVLICSVHSRAPWVVSGSFGLFRITPVRPCVRSIPVRPGGRRVRSGDFGPFSCALGVVGYVRSILVRPMGRQVRSCATCTLPCVLGIVGFVFVRSVHSRAPWESSGSFV